MSVGDLATSAPRQSFHRSGPCIDGVFWISAVPENMNPIFFKDLIHIENILFRFCSNVSFIVKYRLLLL